MTDNKALTAQADAILAQHGHPGHDHGPAEHVHGPDCNHGHDHHHAPARETFVRLSPKIGRNDPCPCGSGKKHKKCCL
jgi:preprotein translocase subunit SecA